MILHHIIAYFQGHAHHDFDTSKGMNAYNRLPTQDSDINALISAADSALYRAKDEGRNQVSPFVVAPIQNNSPL